MRSIHPSKTKSWGRIVALTLSTLLVVLAIASLSPHGYANNQQAQINTETLSLLSLGQEQCKAVSTAPTKQQRNSPACRVELAQYGACFCCNRSGCGCVGVGYCTQAGGICRGPC